MLIKDAFIYKTINDKERGAEDVVIGNISHGRFFGLVLGPTKKNPCLRKFISRFVNIVCKRCFFVSMSLGIECNQKVQ